MPIIYLKKTVIIAILLMSYINKNPAPPDYYIFLKNVNFPSRTLIKQYTKAQIFSITYNCRCYATDHNLEFTFMGNQRDIEIIDDNPKNTMTMDEFAKEANKIRLEHLSISKGNIYLIEQVKENVYIKYKVIFSQIPLEE